VCRLKGVELDEDSMAPPDDFRTISVFPTMEDLSKDELPFLRKNKIKGGYRNVAHYLDVQFRLLREDFVCPLREGIHAYLNMLANPKRGAKLKVGSSCYMFVVNKKKNRRGCGGKGDLYIAYPALKCNSRR
jgi:hypothetical protein